MTNGICPPRGRAAASTFCKMFRNELCTGAGVLVLGNDEHYIMNLRDEMMLIFEESL